MIMIKRQRKTIDYLMDIYHNGEARDITKFINVNGFAKNKTIIEKARSMTEKLFELLPSGKIDTGRYTVKFHCYLENNQYESIEIFDGESRLLFMIVQEADSGIFTFFNRSSGGLYWHMKKRFSGEWHGVVNYFISNAKAINK